MMNNKKGIITTSLIITNIMINNNMNKHRNHTVGKKYGQEQQNSPIDNTHRKSVIMKEIFKN